MAFCRGPVLRRHLPQQRDQEGGDDQGDHDGAEGVGICQGRRFSVRKFPGRFIACRVSGSEDCRVSRAYCSLIASTSLVIGRFAGVKLEAIATK